MNKTILHCLIILMTLAVPACASQAAPPLSPTPISSETPSPTVTPPASTETPTPEPTATPKTSATLTDPVARFELTLLPGWVGIMLDPDSISRASAENPSLGRTLEYVHQTGQGLDRAYLYDPDPADVRDGFVNHALVYFLKNGLITFLPMSAVVQQAGEQLRRLDSTLTITSSTTMTTASGQEIGILEASEAYHPPSGASLNLYDKIVIFKTDGGAAIIFLRVHPDTKDAVVPLFDRMIEEIRLF